MRFRIFACVSQQMAARERRVQMAWIERMAFSAEPARPGLPMDCLSLLFHQLHVLATAAAASNYCKHSHKV